MGCLEVLVAAGLLEFLVNVFPKVLEEFVLVFLVPLVVSNSLRVDVGRVLEDLNLDVEGLLVDGDTEGGVVEAHGGIPVVLDLLDDVGSHRVTQGGVDAGHPFAAHGKENALFVVGGLGLLIVPV